MALRPYQTEALSSIANSEREGCINQLVILPCGSGKTLVAASLPTTLAMQPWESGLFLVHLDELCWQAAAKFKACNPDLIVGIEKAQYHADPSADIVISSVQTLSRSPDRLAAIASKDIRFVFCDEAHRSVSPQWMKVLDQLHVLKGSEHRDPTRLLCGLTATPRRHDGMALEKLFDKIVFRRSIREMIAAGYLVEPIAYRVASGENLDGVSKRMGDFAPGELERAVNTPDRNALVVKKYLEYGAGLSAIAFTVDVQHSTDLASVFQHHGLNFEAMSGNTPEKKRAELVEAHRNGSLTGLVSCGVLCLDDQTEILTDQGWAGIDDMTDQHRTANWENGEIYFRAPRHVVKRQRLPGERMVHLQSQDFDIRVTEDHRMLYRTWRVPGARFKLTTAGSLVARRFQVPISGILREDSGIPISVPSPKSHKQSRHKMLIVAACNLRRREGFSYAESNIEAKRRVDRLLSLRYKDPHELSLAECRFIGFWVGDGTASKLRRSGVENILCQSTRYPKIIEYIRTFLEESRLDFIERWHPAKGTAMPYLTWSIPRGTGSGCQEKRGVYPLEPYLNKQGSSLWWAFSYEQFEAFLHGLWMADGNHGIDGIQKKRSTAIHGTAERKCLDMIQALAVCHGYYTNLARGKKRNPKHAIVNRLTIKKSSVLAVATKPLSFEEDWKNERVWCVTSHSGCIITRRNGKVVVTGNSEGFDSEIATVALMTRPTLSGLLYAQQAGRILRKYPAPENAADHTGYVKQNGILVDFCGLTEQHRLYTASVLFGLNPNFDMQGRSITETLEKLEDLAKDNPTLDLTAYTGLEEVEAASTQVDLWRPAPIPKLAKSCSKFIWIQAAEDVYRLSAPGMSIFMEVNHLGEYEVYRKVDKAEPDGHMKFKEPEDAFARADSLVPDDVAILLTAKARWRKDPPTEPQCNYLSFADKVIRQRFSNGQAFYRFARYQFEKGNNGAFSKGALSMRIELCKRAKEKGISH